MNSLSKEYKEIILFNDSYFSSLISDILTAKKTITLETYIFFDDPVGQAVASALSRAAEKGVQVRLLVDGIGTSNWGGTLTRKLESAGVQTKVYHPIPWRLSHWRLSTKMPDGLISKIIYFFLNLNARNHRKTCFIDKNIVYLGSSNIIQSYIDKDENKCNVRDTNVKLINVDSRELHYAFEKAWGRVSFKKRLAKLFSKMSDDPVFLLNYSWRLRHHSHKILLKKIKNCNTRIWVTNTYFVPDNRFLRKLIKASRNGVDVRVLLPNKYEIVSLSLVTRTFYTVLLEAGVSLYEYLPCMLHAKTLILDNWYSVGSSNLNYRSLKHDLEVDVNVRSLEGCRLLESQFLSDLEQSKIININDLKKMPFISRLMGRLLLLLKYWL